MSVGGITGGTPPVRNTGTAAAGIAEGGRRADPEQTRRILSELAALNTGRGDGPAPAGAPALPPPEQYFSAEDTALILGGLQSKLTDGQLKVASEGVKLDAHRKEQLHQEAMQKLQEAADKTAQSKQLGTVIKVLGYVGKVAAIVGGVAMMAAGAAVIAASSGFLIVPGIAMVALGAGIMGAATADLAWSAASDVSQALGGPDFSLMTLATKAVAELLKAAGASERDAQLAGTVTVMTAQMAVAVIVAAACVALTIPTFGASSAGTVGAIGVILSLGAGIMSGGASVAGGVVGAERSYNNFIADMARADKFDIDRIIARLQEVMQAEQERIGDLVRSMDEAIGRINSMIASCGDTRMQIARRMV